MSETVLLSVRNGLAQITLNRPDRLNSFNVEMADAWARVTAEAVSRDDVGAILLQASGRSFCAGGDVRTMAEMSDRRGELGALVDRINDGIRSLTESSVPVVAAAQGSTVGGGLGILLSTDYAIVGESSKVGSLYANVGLTPDLSVSALLGRAVGERRALQLALRDSLLSAAEAEEWGLVAEVVGDDSLLESAEAVARRWLENATHAYGEAKRLIRSQHGRSFAEQLAEESRTIGAASITPEADERIRAFAAR